jgi:hypothetical protein
MVQFRCVLNISRKLSLRVRRCTTTLLVLISATPKPFLSRNKTIAFGADAALFVARQQQKLFSILPVNKMGSKICCTHDLRRICPISAKSIYTTEDGDDNHDDDDVPTATLRRESSISTDDAISSSTTLISKSIISKQATKTKKGSSGVYVRPSAAIERGSGFFVPGLEGYKVRLFVGSIIVLLTVLLHFYNSHQISTSSINGENMYSDGNNFAECLAIFYGLLVLIQGSIEARKAVLISSDYTYGNKKSLLSSSNGKSVQVYQQQWSVAVSDVDWRNTVEWVASTYLSLTTATNMILIGPGKIIFSLGTNARSSNVNNGDEEAEGCNSALATLAQSKSGRISSVNNTIIVIRK